MWITPRGTLVQNHSQLVRVEAQVDDTQSVSYDILTLIESYISSAVKFPPCTYWWTFLGDLDLGGAHRVL